MKYKVIALSVGGLGNKIFKAGYEVTEANFPNGNAEELVRQGFLVPINNSEKSIIETVLDSVDEDEPEEITSIENFTVKELREITGIKDPKQNKQALYDAYLELNK